MHHSGPYEEGGLHQRVSSLVASGDTGTAELLWNSPEDPPATRGALLAWLAWYGRYTLRPSMNRLPEGDPAVEGYSGELIQAVYSAGWMVPRPDGGFHPEETVSTGDIAILSRYFPGFSGRDHLFLSDLERSP